MVSVQEDRWWHERLCPAAEMPRCHLSPQPAQLAPDVPTSLRCALEEWSSAVLGHWIFVGNLEVLLAPWDG